MHLKISKKKKFLNTNEFFQNTNLLFNKVAFAKKNNLIYKNNKNTQKEKYNNKSKK